MQFTNVLLAIMASAAMVTAAPTEQGVTPRGNGLTARSCPSGYSACGTCNGTQCKIVGINYPCEVGKCTSQSGGGDGKICGYFKSDGNLHCPGTA